MPLLATIPINPATAALVDKGAVELADDKAVSEAFLKIDEALKK